jgi:ketosteroid isomerase-like protein
MKTTVCFLTLFLSMFVLGCNKSQSDTTAESSALLQTDIQFSKTSVAKGAAEAFYEFMDDSSVSLSPNSDPLTGRDKIHERMLSGENDYTLSWMPEKADVAHSGDLGYTWGTYELSFKAEDGTPQARHGKYLNVWRKQADGSWKLLVDIGNQSTAEK